MVKVWVKMVKHKKCCVCGGRNKKRCHKLCDMVELKSYLDDSKYVCNVCRQTKYENKGSGCNRSEGCLLFLTLTTRTSLLLTR